MPAKSVRQQKFFGIVHAIQTGRMPLSKAHGHALTAAKKMHPQDVTEFAETKHKGLPKKANFGWDAARNGGGATVMALLQIHDNPFTAALMLKRADLNGALRSAERALRAAESTRRKSLENHIKQLGTENKKLQQQTDQANQAAAQTSAEAAAMTMQPGSPPAAQPAYGAMLAQDPNAAGQNGNGAQPKVPTMSALKSPASIAAPASI